MRFLDLDGEIIDPRRSFVLMYPASAHDCVYTGFLCLAFHCRPHRFARDD